MYGNYTRYLMESTRRQSEREVARKRGCANGQERGRADRAAGVRRSEEELRSIATFSPCSNEYVEGYLNGYALANPTEAS